MTNSSKIKNGESLKNFLEKVISETLIGKKIIREEEDKALSSGNVSLEDVIDRLNVIRSGKSLKDEDVVSSMKKYLESMDSAEKTALLSFLKGISEIMTAGIPGDKAFEPGDKPATVKMEKKPSSQRVSIKPNIIKKPAQEKKSGAEAEDTTPPAPITPKK